MNQRPDTEVVDSGRRRGRWVLLALFGFFAIPLLVVTAMYRFDWHPSGASRGELVQPPRLLQIPAGLADADGHALPSGLWRDKWSMVYIATTCEQTCIERLLTMRRLHVSMGKDSQRLQRILLTSSNALTEVRQRYPDLLVINQPQADLVTLTRQFDLGDQAGTADRIYLIDPLGNLMMSYPHSVAPAAIRKDLSRLLSYAWAG